MHARVHIRSKEAYVYVLRSTCVVFDGINTQEARNTDRWIAYPGENDSEAT